MLQRAEDALDLRVVTISENDQIVALGQRLAGEVDGALDAETDPHLLRHNHSSTGLLFHHRVLSGRLTALAAAHTRWIETTLQLWQVRPEPAIAAFRAPEP